MNNWIRTGTYVYTVCLYVRIASPLATLRLLSLLQNDSNYHMHTWTGLSTVSHLVTVDEFTPPQGVSQIELPRGTTTVPSNQLTNLGLQITFNKHISTIRPHDLVCNQLTNLGLQITFKQTHPPSDHDLVCNHCPDLIARINRTNTNTVKLRVHIDA